PVLSSRRPASPRQAVARSSPAESSRRRVRARRRATRGAPARRSREFPPREEVVERNRTRAWNILRGDFRAARGELTKLSLFIGREKDVTQPLDTSRSRMDATDIHRV